MEFTTNFFCQMNDAGKPFLVYTNKAYYDKNAESLCAFSGFTFSLPIRMSPEHIEELCHGETPIDIISDPINKCCVLFVLSKKSYKKIFNIHHPTMTVKLL